MNDLRHFLAISSALSDEGRVRTLLALRSGELCVCQIVELLQLSWSTVSKHLSILRQAELVDSRKLGRWMYYRLHEEPSPVVSQAIQWASDSLGATELAADDAKQLKAILKIDPEDLCAGQNQKSKCCSSAPETRVAVRWLKDGRKNSSETPSKRTAPAPSRTA